MRRFALYITALIAALSCADSSEPIIEPPLSEGRVTLELYSDNPLLAMDADGKSGNISFKSRGAEVVIDVVTNSDSWSYSAANSDWLTVESDDYFLTVTAAENDSQNNRSATITVTAGQGEAMQSVDIAIMQKPIGAAEIALESNICHFAAHTDLVAQIAVDTQYEQWDFQTTCSWLLVECVEGALRLTADDNKGFGERTAEIVVVAGEDSDRLVVKQDGTAFVKLSTHNVATDDSGGIKRVAVECNPELEWRVEGSQTDWFSAQRVEDSVEVSVDKNSAGNQRFGAITVTVGDENNNATATINIHQIGADTQALIYEIEVPEPNYLYTAAPVLTSATGGTITVDWGDGSPEESFEARRGTHTYSQPGLYTLYIKGTAKSLEFGAENAYTTELKNIISWGQLGYTTAVDMCLGCSALESIPNDVAGSFASVKSFLGAFSCCGSLKQIPESLFRYATAAKNFEECFSHCGSIESIPENLFAACPAAEDFSYTFYGAGTGVVTTNSTLTNFDDVKAMVERGKLRSIPASLFANNSAIKQFDYVFGATAISEVPEGLFASATNATTFMGAFSACVNLTRIPVSLLDNADAALDIKYMFAGCCSLSELPVGMFTNCDTVTNIEYIFYRTGVKTLRRGLFAGLSKVKTIGAVFQACKNLTTIDGGVFDGLSAVTSFKYCFADCQALEAVPSNLFAGLTTAYDFTYTFENSALRSVPAELFADVRDYSSADLSYTFASCKNLKTVPATLFERFTKITSPGFKYTFYDSALETVPVGLFSKNVNVSAGFENTFNSCRSLKSIEGAIFPQTTTVTSLAYTFTNCTALTSLPAGLFDNLGSSKVKFTATFKGCTALSHLPEALFGANDAATQFSETFSGCTSLESVPASLLGTKEKLTTVKALFEGCSALTTIPAELFALSPTINSFERTFAGCTSLKSLPATLFAAIGTKTTSITFANTFNGCSSLESLPAELFDTVSRINYINGCFENCTSLTGESPYTMVGEQKIHLYERTRGDVFIIVPTSSSSHKGCFAGCKNLSDYSLIPTDWR